MSTIVAIKKDGNIVIGTDSQLTSGDLSFNNTNNTKLIKIPTGYIGVTGLYYLRDLMSYFIKTIDNPACMDDIKTKDDVFEFFQGFWKFLKSETSFNSNDSSIPFDNVEADFILVTKDKIFNISCDLHVSEVESFSVNGSGREIAIGVLEFLYTSDYELDDMCKEVLQVAAKYDIYTGAPFVIKYVV